MKIPSDFGEPCAQALSTLKMLLHQAQSELRLELGRSGVVVPEGQVFDYFDEVRKVIETAREDVLFVDPYLDAAFVARYLPYVASGATTRLLGFKSIPTLLPAVDAFVQQTGAAVLVRSSSNLHDRFVFVDRITCYLSGASFKDGAKKAPATLTQITDAFRSMLDTYERLWTDGEVHRR